MTKTKKPSAKPQAIPKPPAKRGRKSVVTEAMTSKFLVCIENGLTVKESLAEAQMPRGVYDRLYQRSEAFRGQIEVARLKLTIKARANIAELIINKDPHTSRWWLERKVPEEFRPAWGDDRNNGALPEGTVIILPGSKPHPRIVPEGETK